MGKRKTLVKFLLFPNGERLVSWHRHDFKVKEYNGKRYGIDGGQDDYVRIMKDDNEVQYTTESLDTAITWVREDFTWTSILKADGTRRKKPVTKKLSKLTDTHLVALLEWVDEDSFSHKVFSEEIKYRKLKNG